MDTGKIIERLLRALPYPEQMTGITLGTASVQFGWRGARYRVDEDGHVEEVQGGCLVGSDRAILMQKCIDSIKAYDAATEAHRVAA
jgi:hypothetical protein